jgi:cytochrome c peroxidase
LEPPAPPTGSFDAAAAARGQEVFNGAGKCSSCHSGALLTDANTTLHDASEVVSEPEASGVPSYASRSATKQYRTAPLHGLWQHPPYFHNGSAPTLEAVVETYDSKKSLGLSLDQKNDLVQYLRSL